MAKQNQKYRPRVQNMNYAMLFTAVSLLSDHGSVGGAAIATLSALMALAWFVTALVFLEKAE